MLFKVEATKENQYGYTNRLTQVREATNAYSLSEQLKKEGWINSIIRKVN